MISDISFWLKYDMGILECFGRSLKEKGGTCPRCHRYEECKKEVQIKRLKKNEKN